MNQRWSFLLLYQDLLQYFFGMEQHHINNSNSLYQYLKSPHAAFHFKVLIPVENSNTRLLLISCSQGILSSSSFSCYLLLRLLVYMYLSQLMRTFTNYLKSLCHLVLIFHFLMLRISEHRNPTIKHIFTYTLVSSFITKYVIDLFLGSNPHSKIPF